MKEIKETFIEEYEGAIEQLQKQRYKNCTILLSKSMFALCDLIIYNKLKKLPKNHSERFRILEEYFSEIYAIVDNIFSHYTDAYSKPILKDTCEKIENGIKKSSKLMKYQKILKKLLNKDLTDIILFGSFVKGGFAKDIDIALIVKNKTDIAKVKKKIRDLVEDADIQLVESIYTSLWLTLIKEGFSVKEGKYLFEIYNVKPAVLFKYSLKKLNNVQKVQFERGIKKVLGKESVFLTRSVILVPIQKKNEVIDLLKTWNIYYESQEYELLPTMRKEVFL